MIQHRFLVPWLSFASVIVLVSIQTIKIPGKSHDNTWEFLPVNYLTTTKIDSGASKLPVPPSNNKQPVLPFNSKPPVLPSNSKLHVLTSHSNTQLSVSNTSPPLPSPVPQKDEATWTVWTKQPVMPQNPLIVTQVGKSGMHVLLKVQFKVCANVTSCPLTIPEGSRRRHDDRMHSLQYYIIENRTAVPRRHPFALNQVVALSYWFGGQHVALQDVYSKIQCLEPQCPKECATGLHWDREDHLCKPGRSSPDRPWAGACSCQRTCFTPAANNVGWPMTLAQQQEFYPNNTRSPRKRVWELERIQQPVATRFECGDTISYTSPTHAAASHHFVFLPDAKMMFCGIPKVGMSEWLKFFRFTWGAKDYLSLSHYKSDLKPFMVRELALKKAQELLNDPAWTRAVIFRDPAERLLSAYLDKIVGNGYTQKHFRIESFDDDPTRIVLSFAEFVDLVTYPNNTQCNQLVGYKDPRGLHACTDPHWIPQVMLCGLDTLLPHFDFVGNFQHVALHTKMLLQRVNFWDRYGAIFDDGSGQEQSNLTLCMATPPVRDKNFTPWGFNQRGPSGKAHHKHTTGSKNMMDKYYTPELLEKVRKAYAVDFAIWDQLKNRDEKDIPSGRDLRLVQERCGAVN